MGRQIDRKIRTSCQSSARKLWQQLQNTWSSLDQNGINKLVENMSQLVKMITRTKGAFFDEKKVFC